MQTSERGQFEEQWKNVFEGSEAAPSDRVWLSVEGALANTQNDINKGRVVYYQRLAAALLLLFVASALVIFWQADGTSTLAIANVTVQKSSGKVQAPIQDKITTNKEVKVVPETLSANDNPANQGSQNNLQRTMQSTAHQSLKATNKTIHQGPLANSTLINSVTISKESATAPDSLSVNVAISNTNSATILESNENEKVKPLTDEEEKAIVKKMLADAGVGEDAHTEEKKIILKNPAWISVGASGGSYATQADAPAPAALADFAALSNVSSMGGYNQTGSVNKPASLGTAYSFGFMVGKPLSKRWLLQAGLTYVNRRSDYESNIVANGDEVFYPQIVKSSMSSSYSFTNSYSITSTTEFLSVPVQLGFVIIDRKIGWIVNSGISGDIFLRNTLVDKSGTYKLVSQSGDDTAYRFVSWSGLASTEVTLRLSEHYRFALVPGLRYSITNIVNDESGYAKPLTLDIGFRFRYTF